MLMFYRKISKLIEEHFTNLDNPILMIDGARQIGKSFIIRETLKPKFKNFIEINMYNDFIGDKLFEKVTSIDNFYLQLSILAGDKLGAKEDTIIFLDEIQVYPHLFTLLKFLKMDNRYTYICSGSQLGIALKKTTSIPMGSINKVRMYPMDFEEFLLANNIGYDIITYLKDCLKKEKTLMKQFIIKSCLYIKYIYMLEDYLML